MKYLALLTFSVLCLSGSAQMNEVSGGNIGLTIHAGAETNASSLDYKSPLGMVYGFGLTTRLADLVFPTVQFESSSLKYGFADSNTTMFTNRSSSLGLGANFKIPVFSIALGKSNKGECTYLRMKLLVGYNYAINFKDKANFDYVNKNDQQLEFGFGINPRFSGGHKSRVAWNYYFDFVYRFDLNKNNGFTTVNGTDWTQNGFFFRFTVLHHKTSDFLGGNKPKKSYKKKY